MTFLKVFATTILAIIILFVLGVFNLAFLVHGTVLSPNFVTRQVDKIPISSIARDIAEDQIGQELPQSSEFLSEVAFRIIEKQEPWIKTQLDDAINTGYDYFLGKTTYLSITVPLAELKTDLESSFWTELRGYLQEELTGKSDAEISAYFQDIIQELPQDNLPEDLASLPAAERNLYIEQYFRDIAGVPQKSGAPPLDPQYRDLADQYADEFIHQFVNGIADSYTIDESSIGSSTMNTLRDVRRGISYFQTYFYWLIVLLIILIGLVFLVNWGVKVPARVLGIEFLVLGVIYIADIFILRALPLTRWIAQSTDFSIPAGLDTWIHGLINDVTMVMLPLAIVILIVGLTLTVVSFMLPSPKKEVV
jgi:hypothetical protein